MKNGFSSLFQTHSGVCRIVQLPDSRYVGIYDNGQHTKVHRKLDALVDAIRDSSRQLKEELSKEDLS